MIALVNSTGNTHIDTMIAGIIGVYDSAFPDRIRGYYIVGSYSDNTPVKTSDIDMTIIFKGTITPEERTRQNTIKAGLRVIAPLHLDLPVFAEADLHISDTIALKYSSLHVYGEDTREPMPEPPIDLYLKHISTPTHLGLTVRFRTETVTVPLDYPVPDDAYYGYMPERENNTQGDIKLWVLHVGWLATFLVVHHAGVYVPSKNHLLSAYRQHIGDEWTDFITQVMHNGRERWAYTLPDDDADRAVLHELCRCTLAFEKHVANTYLTYLQNQRAVGDSDFAENRLRSFNVID